MYEFCFLTADRGADFVDRVQSLGLVVTCRPDPVNETVTLVAIPDDTDEALLDQIESWYEAQTQHDDAAARAAPQADEWFSAGIWVPLAGGESSLARVDPVLMNRLLTILTLEELGQFVAVIADAVEHPNHTPLCASGKPQSQA